MSLLLRSKKDPHKNEVWGKYAVAVSIGKGKFNLPAPTMCYQHSAFELHMVYKSHQRLHVKLKSNRLSARRLVAPSMADPIESINFMALLEKSRQNLHRAPVSNVTAGSVIAVWHLDQDHPKKHNIFRPTFLHI